MQYFVADSVAILAKLAERQDCDVNATLHAAVLLVVAAAHGAEEAHEQLRVVVLHHAADLLMCADLAVHTKDGACRDRMRDLELGLKVLTCLRRWR